MELNLPLVLESAAAGAFCAQVGQGECVQQWMLCNPAKVLELQQEFLNAGAQVLCAPTGGIHALGLSTYELPAQQAEKMNSALVALTIQAAGENPVAGILSSAGHLPEPYGPLPYTDLIDIYAQQALELRAAGVQLLVLTEMSALADIRAAVLGARQSRLPLVAVLRTDETPGADPLAVLLCLQELGIAAFGICHPDLEEMPGLLRRLAPHAKIPLAAAVEAGHLTPDELVRPCFEMLAAGARILLGSGGIGPAHIAEMRRLTEEFDFSAFPLPEPQQALLVLSDNTQVYYLEKDYTPSAAINCQAGQSEAILRAEEEGSDILLFHIKTIEDARFLGQNTHIAGTPVGFLAENEEALEVALLLYSGRALVDSRSNVAPEVLRVLAQGYGAELR